MMKVKYIGKSEWLVLTYGKTYEVIAIEKEWYRIIDDSADGYLYPPYLFVILKGK